MALLKRVCCQFHQISTLCEDPFSVKLKHRLTRKGNETSTYYQVKVFMNMESSYIPGQEPTIGQRGSAAHVYRSHMRTNHASLDFLSLSFLLTIFLWEVTSLSRMLTDGWLIHCVPLIWIWNASASSLVARSLRLKSTPVSLKHGLQPQSAQCIAMCVKAPSLPFSSLCQLALKFHSWVFTNQLVSPFCLRPFLFHLFLFI